MPDEPLEVAVAVIEREGKFLIAQRKPEDSFGGQWEFPGGKLRPGEDLAECLTREIREELGVTISVGPRLCVIDHTYPTRAIRLHCFACRIAEGEPQAIECSQWQWIGPQELNRFRFPPASGPIIAEIQKRSAIFR